MDDDFWSSEPVRGAVCPRCGAPSQDGGVCRDCRLKETALGVGSKVVTAVPVSHFSFRDLKAIFSETVKRHSSYEAEMKFAAISGAVDPTDVWPRPWLFLRVLGLLGGGFLVLLWMYKSSGNMIVIPGVILLGAFAVPVSVAIMFLECNTPRNISFYSFMRFFISGAVLSIAVAIVIYQFKIDQIEGLGASGAAFVEEPAKLLAVIFLARGLSTEWTLNGLALGAAVGAGFAAFETAGYALGFAEVDVSLETIRVNVEDILVLRAWTSLGAHVMWTAIAAAALWTVMNGRPFHLSMLFSYRFLVPFGLVIALHFVWNSQGAQESGTAAYVALIALAWCLAMAYLLMGARQFAYRRGASQTSGTVGSGGSGGSGGSSSGSATSSQLPWDDTGDWL